MKRRPITRVYVAGPMTGLPALNYPAFHAAASRLRALAFEVNNPAELDHPPGASWLDCMRLAIPALMTCDAVALLPGWEASRGARIECWLAHDLGLEVGHIGAPLFAAGPAGGAAKA